MRLIKVFFVLFVILFSIGNLSAEDFYQEIGFDTGKVCMNTGLDSANNFSDYVINFSGRAGYSTLGTGNCLGHYLVMGKGSTFNPSGKLFLNSSELPFGGIYNFTFSYSIGDNLNQLEDFNISCGGVTRTINEPERTTPTNQNNVTQIFCPSGTDLVITINTTPICGVNCWLPMYNATYNKTISISSEREGIYSIDGIIYRNSGGNETHEDVYLEVNKKISRINTTDENDYLYKQEYLGEFELLAGNNNFTVHHTYICDLSCTCPISPCPCRSQSVILKDLCLYKIDDSWKNSSLECEFEKGSNAILLTPRDDNMGSSHFDWFRIYNKSYQLKIGSCKINSTIQDCNQGAIEYSITNNWTWGFLNNYSTWINNFSKNSSHYLQFPSGIWHYDPDNESGKCIVAQSGKIPCVDITALNFFDFYNFILTVILIAVIYYFFFGLRKVSDKFIPQFI